MKSAPGGTDQPYELNINYFDALLVQPFGCAAPPVTTIRGNQFLGAAGYGIVTATHVAGDRGGALARLFTTTTLLSLGGAYAVVPWALDESVTRGWLAADEWFTALAMGEVFATSDFPAGSVNVLAEFVAVLRE